MSRSTGFCSFGKDNYTAAGVETPMKTDQQSPEERQANNPRIGKPAGLLITQLCCFGKRDV